MKNLSIDIETRSGVNIDKTGSYRYAMDPEFKILLFAYREDWDPVRIVDLEQGEQLPDKIIRALSDRGITKHAYNAAFEWFCLNRAGYKTPLSQWEDTMAQGMYCGYPAGLEAIGSAIGLPQEKQKLATGKALIRYFCIPCAPTKTNGGRRWNLPRHEPEKWKLFKEYCMQDVLTESSILDMLSMFPMPEQEWKQWRMDVRMNAVGVRADWQLVEGALKADQESTEELAKRAAEITGLDNPNSVVQLQVWLETKGVKLPNLQKATVADALEEEDLPEEAREVLKIRQQAGKTSVKKYVTMETARCPDGRIRGLTQYYGATRTGRWAGRLVQMQNLPRNHMGTLREARSLVKHGNTEGVKLIYGNVPDTLSQLVRTAFIPSEGNHFVVADFSAIEARVIAWIAGEQWVNEVFATHGKIYEATASQMFNVPVEKIKKGNPEYSLRQKGKVATLALGYQGGAGSLIAMGALDMGLPEEELPDIVSRWRQANPMICKLWKLVEDAALSVVMTGHPRSVRGMVTFRLEGTTDGRKYMTIELPSGRKLFYPDPEIGQNRFGKTAIFYSSLGQTSHKWCTNSTYGGKLTENIVQAVARDCLAVSLERIYDRGLQVVFHVHDEVIIDAPMDITCDEICGLMGQPIDWAPGLVLKAAGFENDFYMKD